MSGPLRQPATTRAATRGVGRGLIATAVAVLLLGTAPETRACSPREPTRETGPGPHDFTTAPSTSRLWHEGDEGEPLSIRGRVLDTCGKPVPDARVRIVHANHHGAHEADRWRTHLTADRRGAFSLVTVFPGYTGGLPRHIHFIITHPAHHELVTRLFFKNDPSVGDAGEDLAMVLEEVRRGDAVGWVATYEFVLAPR